VVRHDDERAAWYGPGGHHGLMPVGVPANSTQKNFSLGQGQDLLHAARFQGQWRSLLTSLHLSCLHESLRGSASATTAFPDELKASQRRWGRALGTMPAEARRAYSLLHWCDGISLILCRHELPAMGCEVEPARCRLATEPMPALCASPRARYARRSEALALHYRRAGGERRGHEITPVALSR